MQPYTSKAKDLLRHLTPLVEWRGREETAVAQRLKEQSSQAERELRSRADELTGTLGEAMRIADASKSKAVDDIREKHEREMMEARKDMETEVGRFSETTDRLETKAEKKLENSHWMASTLVESSEGKAKKEFDSASSEHKSRTDELGKLQSQAAELLARYKHAPLPTYPPATLRENPTPLAAVTAARTSLTHLASRVEPGLLRLSSVLIFAFILIAGGAVGGAMLLKDQRPPTAASLGAGAGLVAALLLFVVLRAALRTRVAAAAKFHARTLATAQDALTTFISSAEAIREAQLAEGLRRRDEELAKGQKRFDELQEEITDRRNNKEPALRAKHHAYLSRVNAKTTERTGRVETEYNRLIAAAKERHASDLAAATSARDARVAAARAEYDAALVGIAARWVDGMAHAKREIAEITEFDRPLSPPWNGPDWQNFTPRDAVPTATRFGLLRIDIAQMAGGVPSDPQLVAATPPPFDLPAMLDFLGTGSLLIQTAPEARAQSIATLQAVMLRLLTTFPPGKMKFTIIDPVGLGQNFAGFMHLADHDETLVSDKIWTDTRHIEQKLTDLTEHMEAVIQKYLRNEFATIQAYNEKAGEVAEPFRFLVIADFPANFNETAAKKLASIVASGPRCGVFTLIATDTRQRPPAWVPLAEVEHASLTLVTKDGRLTLKDADFGPWPFTPEAPASDEIVTQIAHSVGKHAKEAGKVQVPFDLVTPKGDQMWSMNSAREVRVPLGRAGATKLQNLSLGLGTAQHVLIAGRTGSGKSTLLHALITNLAMWYSPEEIEFYLLDFKKGVEFKTYASHKVPHARVVAVESEREFGLSVLRRLDAELTKRGQTFRELGIQDLNGYRKVGPTTPTHPAMPRTLLIVDEFQEFFTEDDKLAQEAMLLLDRLVRQGRAFGMHVVLGSQTIGGAYSLARSTLGQMAIRIALQCSEADSYLIMSEDNSAPRLLNRPGEAIYNDASGMIEGNSPFQVVWLPDETRDKCLQAVEDRYQAAGFTVTPPIVFEGNIPSKLSDNHTLVALLSGKAPVPQIPTVWLGEAISIKEPTNVRLRRQSGSNLLIVGQQEHAALGVVLACLIALASQQPAAAGASGVVPITILDGGSADSERTSELYELAAALGPVARVHPPREADAAVAALSQELERRRTGSAATDPLVLVVWGLHRFRSLRKNDADFGYESDSDAPAATADKQFAKLLREGPLFGIHVIARADTATNLDRVIDRRAIKEFDHRVLFQMSANDSSNLIEGTQAAALGQHRGLLYSDETGTVEKFRPYALPTIEWIKTHSIHRPVAISE
ncbi:MAG: FtsK/SpoIIIE domain-containing protein [Planctomycetota bacterium]